MPDCLQEILDRTKAGEEPGNAPLPTLENLINEYVRYLIRLTSHNIALTAKILNVSRSTLYHRLRRLEPRP
jgi:transcriptional regulator of acetoin/glycerol metabolism